MEYKKIIHQIFYVIAIVLVIESTPICAQVYTLAKKPSVKIQSIELIGEAKKGDIFNLKVRYKSFVDASAQVTFRVPEHVSLPERTLDSRSVLLNRNVSKAATYVEQFTIKADNTGNGIYEIQIKVSNAPLGYSKKASQFIKIRSKKNEFEVFDPQNPGDRKPKVIGKDIQTQQGEKSRKGNAKNLNIQSQPNQNYSISVSGKIRFLESSFPQEYRGVYGNAVVLWFRNSSNPNDWYHPLIGNTKNTHYDILDEQGNFSFNFNFTGDLSGYNEMIVLVNTANDATIMPVPNDGYIVQTGSGYKAYFNESEGLSISISTSQTNITVNQNGEMNANAGRILRYSQISNEFTEEIYNGNMTFSVPAIPTRIANISACGTFYNSYSFLQGWSQSIDINPNCTDFTTISHEYGHWTHYRMWTNNSKWNGASDALQEGWAVFYSFASRNYGNKQYGDELEQFEDNTEEDAFVNSPYRYAGIGYASPNAPSFGKSAAAFSCYLWNLYDNPTDNNFLANIYDNAENDDVQNQSYRVFEKMRTLGSTSVSNYNNHFKSGLSSTLQTSVENVYDFMFDDLNNLPSTKMKSAQIRNFSTPLVSSSSVTFSWSSGSYLSGNYKNQETGYKIYKLNGLTWSQITTVSYGTNSYTYSSSHNGRFKISAYNQEGDSENPVITNLLPQVFISGLDYFNSGTNATWTVSVSGGEPPYNYTWYRSYTSSSGPYSQVGTGTSYSQTVTNEMYLKLKVEDDNTNTDQDIKHIFVLDCDDPQGCPDPEASPVTAGPVERDIPETFILQQNFPNPFNPTTQISYGLPEAAQVSITVYDITGRQVAVLANGSQSAGRHTVSFRAENLSSGMYIARIEALGSSGQVFTRNIKMQLIK